MVVLASVNKEGYPRPVPMSKIATDGISTIWMSTVHVSQICEKRIKTPAAVLKVGDKVKVKVINVKDGKLSLSVKALNDVAAEEIQEETIELPETEAVGTSLGSLFACLLYTSL